MGKVELVNVIKTTRAKADLWLVYMDGTMVGQVEKYKDGPSMFHPWKAFRDSGAGRKYLGAFYPVMGGKKAAVKAVLDAAAVAN